MKAAILYYTREGNTEKCAALIKEGMERVEGMEAKTFPLDAIDKDWVKDSACVIIGAPTYYADMPSEVHTFLEGLGEYGVAGKLGGAFATARFVYGGSELVIQNINKFLIFWGMLVYAGGTALGKPPIHTGPSAINGLQEEFITDTFRLYGQRMAEKAAELFG